MRCCHGTLLSMCRCAALHVLCALSVAENRSFCFSGLPAPLAPRKMGCHKNPTGKGVHRSDRNPAGNRRTGRPPLTNGGKRGINELSAQRQRISQDGHCLPEQRPFSFSRCTTVVRRAPHLTHWLRIFLLVSTSIDWSILGRNFPSYPTGLALQFTKIPLVNQRLAIMFLLGFDYSKKPVNLNHWRG